MQMPHPGPKKAALEGDHENGTVGSPSWEAWVGRRSRRPTLSALTQAQGARIHPVVRIQRMLEPHQEPVRVVDQALAESIELADL